MPLDLCKELRHVAAMRYVAALHADGGKVRTEHLHPFGIRRLVETRQYLYSTPPELLRNGFVRRHHALLHHLVGFVVRTLLDSRHLTIVVYENLRFRHVKIKSAGCESQFAQLLRKLMDGKHCADLTLRDSGTVPPLYESHHLFVGETRLRTDDRLRKPAGDAVSMTVEREKCGERKPILPRHE